MNGQKRDKSTAAEHVADAESCDQQRAEVHVQQLVVARRIDSQQLRRESRQHDEDQRRAEVEGPGDVEQGLACPPVACCIPA